MVYHKNYLEVDRVEDTLLYRICSDLKIHGKSIVETKEDWGSTSRKFGVRIKPLINKNKPDESFIYPIGRTKNNRKFSIALIQTPNDVVVMERKINERISRFIFKKIQIS